MDMLARTVWIDDRGQATVTAAPRYRADEAFVYFGFDFLVEANIDNRARHWSGDDEISRNALRRQADCLLAPFTRRVWVQSAARRLPSINPAQLRWLDRPYKPSQERGNDVNLNAERIGACTPYSAAGIRFAGAARFAEKAARDELARVTDLTARCEEARRCAGASLDGPPRPGRGPQGRRPDRDRHRELRHRYRHRRRARGRTGHPSIKVISVTCLVRAATLPGVDGG